MADARPWEAYLQSRFPGYLLPDSAATALSRREAQRFLEGIGGRPDQVDVLRAASFLAPRAAGLREFVRVTLLDLVRNLNSRTERVRREWDGAFHGRLAVGDTLNLHLAGRRTAFVTHSRMRVFDVPENVVVRAVCERLLRALVLLRSAEALPETGWAVGLRDCEGVLRKLLLTTALRDVPLRRFGVIDANAARTARHRGYHEAAYWAEQLRALDSEDPARIAQIVAEGALLPTSDSTRFELAVAIRFAEALEARLAADEPERWSTERALILPGRKDMIAFVHDDGRSVRVFYNQAVLPSGAADRGSKHYFGIAGRLRPDIVLELSRDGQRYGALVVECKLSEDPSYILGGYHEAMLYRWEYAEHLITWPKVVLVASGPVTGVPRASDDVIASTWADWPAAIVIDAVVREICW